MKYDPDSKVRSQRENMQAFQLRLPKDTIRELQMLRVFARVKVSEELRDLIVNYARSKAPLIRETLEDIRGGGKAEFIIEDEEHLEAVEALSKKAGFKIRKIPSDNEK